MVEVTDKKFEPSVLIVDDDEEVADFLELCLKEKKCKVTAAYDGLSALKKIEQYKFDLILLDVIMPGKTGVEVCQILKSNPKTKHIPVIMITTTDDLTEIDLCHQLGCSFYMVKPADYNKFMAAVENLGVFLSLGSIKIPPIGDTDTSPK